MPGAWADGVDLWPEDAAADWVVGFALVIVVGLFAVAALALDPGEFWAGVRALRRRRAREYL
jgi:hypothetical protein